MKYKPLRQNWLFYIAIFNYLAVNSVVIQTPDIVLQFLVLQLGTALIFAPAYFLFFNQLKHPELGKVKAFFVLALLIGCVFSQIFIQGGYQQSSRAFFEAELAHPALITLKVIYALELLLIWWSILIVAVLLKVDKWIFKEGTTFKEQYWQFTGVVEKKRLKKLKEERTKKHLLPISVGGIIVWFFLLLFAAVLVLWGIAKVSNG